MSKTYFLHRHENLLIHHSCDDVLRESSFVLHAHRNYELYYFISGTGHYTVEGTEYPLSPGCMLIMRDGEAHTPHMYGKEPYERISINFSPELMPSIEHELRALYCDRPLGKGNCFFPGEENLMHIKACMRRLCKDGESENYKARACVILMNILLELYDMKCHGADQHELPALPDPDGNAETVRRIIRYINENLTTLENLDVLEQEFFFSKSYINRMFKQSTGSSVWDYVVLKRLLLSRTLLREGKQAGIVAAECGFSDYSSFYRQFKQRFGISPLAAKLHKG